MFIDHENIERLASLPEPKEADALLALKAASMAKGLSLEEAAMLLAIREPSLIDLQIKTAAEVKEKVFGKRIVLFAPLYLSNHCTNGCKYCGFRSGGSEIARKALSVEEAVTEAKALEAMGFKRVLLVTGEDPRWGLDYIVSCVRAIYGRTGIRIVHVNAPPMDTDSLRELKASGAGVYQSFQETYHRPTYEEMHPFGRKKDYSFRLGVMDRAMEAGFGDVGIGPLLGLYDYRFDALSAIAHSLHLYDKFGAHAHTISIPRLRPAEDGLKDVPMGVTDQELKKIVAVFRLSVPSAGIVASTREPASLRAELIHAGATQLSAASRTSPGGYAGKEASLEQFSTTDHRGLAEVMKSVIDEGLLPSLCTACYRAGRIGGDFTGRTVAGEMEKFCQANAVLTLKEYLLDFCNNGTRDSVERAIDQGLDGVKDQGLKNALAEKIEALEKGKRDQYF